MELNMDCIRDVMLTIQDNTGLDYGCKFLNYRLQNDIEYQHSDWTPEKYQDSLDSKYGFDVVLYHLDLCFEAGYLVETPLNKRNYIDKHCIHIWRPTMLGHNFIENTKPVPMWNSMKALAGKGIVSLPTIVSMATDENLRALLAQAAQLF